MAIEIVSFPVKNGGSFHRFLYVYQRVMANMRIPNNAGITKTNDYTMFDHGACGNTFGIWII